MTTTSSNNNPSTFRRVSYYILLATFIADIAASQAGTLQHLTLWSYFLHILYFELPLTSLPTSTLQTFLVKFFHGPSFCGAHALFAMYLWTLYANPTMEFDLAPPGRAAWLVLARAFWLHAGPVGLHWIDWTLHGASAIRRAYVGCEHSKLWQFWACVGGYFAMGLTWEQVNGDSAGTYNVESMSPETYVNVSKGVGILSCLAAFFGVLKPSLFSSSAK